MVQKVEMFKSSDGVVFDSERECVAHESAIAVTRGIAYQQMRRQSTQGDYTLLKELFLRNAIALCERPVHSVPIYNFS